MYLRSWLLCAIALAVPTAAFYPNQHTQSSKGGGDTVHVVSMRQTNGNNAPVLAKRSEIANKLTMKRKAPLSKSGPHEWARYEGNEVDRRRPRQAETEAGSPVKRNNGFNIVTAAKPTQTNNAPIDEDGTDFSYFAPVSFGSRHTLMYMLVDTGAANTWVMGSNCSTEACKRHNTFGEQDSTTFKPTGDTFNLTYGTGSVSGATVNDTVQIAGMSIPLSFGAASTTSDDFLEYPMDGILGLGRSASNTMQSPTVMEAIMDTKELPANLFGVNLQRNSDGSTDGELSFGAPDNTKYHGDLLFTDTVSDGKLWEIPVDDAGFDGNLCKFTGKSAVIDTGTTFMLLPPDDSKQLHSQIPQSQQEGAIFNIPCSTKQPVQIIISGVSYNITPRDYIGNPVKGGNLCESNIIGKQAFQLNQWLLGDVFLKNVYTVFDFDKNRIGFGVKGESSASTASSSASATGKPTKTATMPGSASANASASSVTRTALLPEGSVPSSTNKSASGLHPTTAAGPSGTSSSNAVAAPHVAMFTVYIISLLLTLYY